MLSLSIPGKEIFLPETNEFRYADAVDLEMEHSLDSLSAWEMQYEKPFLRKADKSIDEWMYYFKCMTINGNFPIEVYYRLTSQNIDAIKDYINRPMTAFHPIVGKSSGRREIITAESIYYSMISCNIPMECSRWHLNRLRALIDMFSIKNSPPKKMSDSEIYARNRRINEMNKAKYHTKG